MKNKIRHDILEIMKSKPSNPKILYDKLFNSDFWKKAKVIGVTVSTPIELDTLPIINQALSEHKEVAIPKTFSNRVMKFYKYTSINDLVKSKFGILEPTATQTLITKNQIDLIIVPGVAFSKFNHHRIGYGGGFFDCYLQDYQGTTVSLVRNIQLSEQKWEVEKNDIAVQYLITEEK